MPDTTQRHRRFAALAALVTGVGGIVAIAVDADIADVLAFAVSVVASAVAFVAATVAGGLLDVVPTAIRETRRFLRRSSVVTHVSRLLPEDVREEYREEWAAWMSDLRIDGTPRVRRWVELLSIILIAAPRLAITLRLSARRAVDR